MRVTHGFPAITAITTCQVITIITTGNQVFLRFGRDDVRIPEPMAGLFQTLVRPPR
jgi:hypothetical protein